MKIFHKIAAAMTSALVVASMGVVISASATNYDNPTDQYGNPYNPNTADTSWDAGATVHDYFYSFDYKARHCVLSITSDLQYPRDVQTEVWNQWFENKNEKNSIIKMNTGSGKTVVGLVILRSCLLDGVGPAVYVVPDNYLVNKVIDEASRLGIQVTKNEDDYLFKNGNAILVINIHKLVNGKSIFGLRTGGNNVPIGSLILDDVHACIDTINQQFTLAISSVDEAYDDIINILRSSVENYSKQLYSDIIQRNDPTINMMLPYWIWQDKCIDVYNLLKEKYSDADYVRFNLPLISSAFNICNCCISATSIEISPNCLDT